MQKLIIIFVFFLNFGNVFSNDEYFLTLRNEKVNLRQGPSFDYPVKIFYEKRFLPVLVQDSSENFRKIRDHENNSGWVHISQLSKKRAAIVINKEVYIYSGKTVFSKPRAVAKTGKLLLIKKCYDEWCKISNKEVKGWVKTENLWCKLK